MNGTRGADSWAGHMAKAELVLLRVVQPRWMWERCSGDGKEVEALEACQSASRRMEAERTGALGRLINPAFLVFK